MKVLPIPEPLRSMEQIVNLIERLSEGVCLSA